MPTPRPALAALALLALATGCASTPEGAPSPSKTAAAKPAPAASAVVRINDDVSCDKAAKRCDFRGNPSVGLTRTIFGDRMAGELQATSGVPVWKSDPIVTPGTGQSCDTLSAACFDKDGPNVELTRSVFGGNAATNLDKRMRKPAKGREIVRYGTSVTCDRQAGICYDRLGASVGYTRLYLGKTQSEELLDRMRPHFN
jgi:hypothetical protein